MTYFSSGASNFVSSRLMCRNISLSLTDRRNIEVVLSLSPGNYAIHTNYARIRASHHGLYYCIFYSVGSVLIRLKIVSSERVFIRIKLCALNEWYKQIPGNFKLFQRILFVTWYSSDDTWWQAVPICKCFFGCFLHPF